MSGKREKNSKHAGVGAGVGAGTKAQGSGEFQDLEMYMEKLYDDDMESKTFGAEKILHISLQVNYIEALIQDEALMVCSPSYRPLHHSFHTVSSLSSFS